jgi:hypothetical protein
MPLRWSRTLGAGKNDVWRLPSAPSRKARGDVPWLGAGRVAFPRLRLGLGLAVLALAGCADLPKDPEGTLERIRASGELRVGLIADPQPDGMAGRYLARVAGATGARPAIVSGPSERLLTELEHGRLDLVLGELRPDTPWTSHVNIVLHPDQPTNEPVLVTAAAARHGENAWIMLLEREAGRLGGDS